MLSLALFALAAASLLIVLAVFLGLVVKSTAMTADQELKALERPADLAEYPLVSVIAPVRNEERNIAPLLESLLAWDYPKLEILLADDGSTDRTVELARQIAGDDPRVRILSVPELEAGDRSAFKSGKAFVLAQAAGQATGEWLLFVDADTRHHRDGLWRAMRFVRERSLPAFSGSGVYVNPGFWGEVLEATLYIAVFFAIPLRRVNDDRCRDLGWMNGQFILLERAAYERVGGHAALAPFAQDDLAMGRLLKERGIPYRFLPDAQLYECVNYVGLKEAYRGWTRLVAAGTPWLRRGRPFFLTGIAALLATGVLPFVIAALVASGAVPDVAVGPVTLKALSASTCGLALLVQLVNRQAMRLALWRTLLLPIGALLTAGVLASAYRIRFGGAGYDLRGRTLTPDDPESIRAALAAGAPDTIGTPPSGGAA